MAETSASTSHAQRTEQAATSSKAIHDLDTSPIAIDEANPLASGNYGTPAESLEPGVPPEQSDQLAPEEDELDELIIEDFTIDGICGVY